MVILEKPRYCMWPEIRAAQLAGGTVSPAQFLSQGRWGKRALWKGIRRLRPGLRPWERSMGQKRLTRHNALPAPFQNMVVSRAVMVHYNPSSREAEAGESL